MTSTGSDQKQAAKDRLVAAVNRQEGLACQSGRQSPTLGERLSAAVAREAAENTCRRAGVPEEKIISIKNGTES